MGIYAHSNMPQLRMQSKRFGAWVTWVTLLAKIDIHTGMSLFTQKLLVMQWSDKFYMDTLLP